LNGRIDGDGTLGPDGTRSIGEPPVDFYRLIRFWVALEGAESVYLIQRIAVKTAYPHHARLVESITADELALAPSLGPGVLGHGGLPFNGLLIPWK